MRTVSYWVCGAALAVVMGCGGSAEVSGTEGSTGGSPPVAEKPPNESPAEPGAPVELGLPEAEAAEYARLQEALSAASSLTAEQFAKEYALQHVGLDYDPTQAANMNLIQASALALNGPELELLKQNGFVISASQEFPTFGYGYAAIYGADLPLYVTADSILHAVHRSYDDILKAIETEVLIPTLAEFLDSMRNHLAASADVPEQTRADADFYLAVGRGLLAGSAVAPVAGAEAGVVKTFVDSATAAKGMEERTIFGVLRRLDFSQFTPRGHYTDTVELGRYFRAMMWLGRIDFRLIETQEDHSQLFHRRQFDAMLALRSLMSEADLARFHKIDTTIEGFVGESDYMTVPQVDALLADLGATSLTETASLTDEQIVKAIVAGGYGTQRISSHIMINGLKTGTLPLSSSFLIFGQRYVVDSHVFSNLVYDRVQDGRVTRMMPDPLDAAFAALGNDQAGALLSGEIAQYEYAPDLHSMRLLVDAHDAEFWQGNLYNLWLGALRALSPERGSVADPAAAGLPRIAGTEAWGRRILNTQLASWAELRHDTILYAKQSYTGGIACEFPDAYVDPYPEVYRSLVRFAEQGALRAGIALEGVSGSLAQAVTDYFTHLKDVTSTLAGMAESQRQGIPFSEAQMAFINDAVVLQVEGCGWPVWTSGWYGRLFFDKNASGEQDPTIADVHTQPTDESGTFVGRVLHVGTGNARLMVVTADTCTGPRAYLGVASSYYEKVTENFERLTDEQWQSQLYQSPPADVEWLAPTLAR